MQLLHLQPLTPPPELPPRVVTPPPEPQIDWDALEAGMAHFDER